LEQNKQILSLSSIRQFAHFVFPITIFCFFQKKTTFRQIAVQTSTSKAWMNVQLMIAFQFLSLTFEKCSLGR